MWVDQETLNILSDFFSKGGLDHAFTKVGPSLDIGVLPLERIKGYAISMMGVSSVYMDVYFHL